MQWTTNKIVSYFSRSLKLKNPQGLIQAEKQNIIPVAERISRGNTKVRYWTYAQIPSIGEMYGFLSKPKGQQVITVYSSKGGVLKTTLAHELARTAAINGIKTIIVGLDIQLSITECIKSRTEGVQDNDDLEYYNGTLEKGIWHFLFENEKIDNIIKHTEIPTLDYIPETVELNAVEKQLRNMNRREYLFIDKLIPALTDYDLIIFDNSPSWNSLIENSLVAANHVISPFGCDINSYRALSQHLDFTGSYKETMKLNWDSYSLIPTKLKKTKLSQQIYATYITEHPDICIPRPIRDAVVGDEASLLGLSTIEYNINSPLAQDYLDTIIDIYSKISSSKIVEK